MNLFTRIFIGFLLIVILSSLFFYRSVMSELRPATRQAMEEAMVDTANLLAEIVTPQFNDSLPDSHFARSVDAFLKRQPQATIWGYKKNSASYRIYITDAQGKVIYDSRGSEEIGKDYSQWNDVYLTLRGKYGARSSRTNEADSATSILYVAAPIFKDGKIAGVLSVAKPALSIQPFIDLSESNIVRSILVLIATALFFSWLVSYWLTQSVRRLSTYAIQTGKGGKSALPRLPEPEMRQLGSAIETMRRELDGKAYVEQYIHTLTHEIKSPLSGIKGASELLSEEMKPADRERFLENIRGDAQRIQQIVDRMLALASVEFQEELQLKETVSLVCLLHDIAQQKHVALSAKSLKLDIQLSVSFEVVGDPFLLEQAISNILDNAIDFTLPGRSIHVGEIIENNRYQLVIRDEGSGIPDYAIDRVFERFYSLPRPRTGKRSSGLGLNFVKEVMELHGASIGIESGSSGTVVTLTFPQP